MPHNCNEHANVQSEDIAHMDDESTMFDMAATFKVLGDRTRMKILFALLSGEKNVCTISELIASTHSNTSHQLKILKDNRLVDYKKIGKEVFYFLADHHIKTLMQVAIEHVREQH